MGDIKSSYDQIPYRSNPFPQTRPERLSAVGRMFGLEAPPIENCRVLELGCSSGGNIIPFAQEYPRATVVGIDASARQIADGWTMIDAAGLKNIQLKHMDILNVTEELGRFDYIISHGVFSWVPAAVQDKMIEICHQNLSPNGVAYISYNTYPGWHIRGIVRDMMLYRATQFPDPATQLAQAKGLVEFVAKATKNQETPYKHLLQSEFDILSKREDYYLHHEHLEEHNQPLYFHQFAEKLSVNGLQFLGEADFSTMVSTNFAPDVAQILQKLGAHDILQMEQYMDFVRCRYFRQTLICHRSVALKRQIGPEVVKNLYLASNAASANAEVSMNSEVVEKFRTPAGNAINCRHPLTKLALLKMMRAWPMPIQFSELVKQATAEAQSKGIAIDTAQAEKFMGVEMLSCIAAGIVEWRVSPVNYTTNVASRPVATAFARFQASQSKQITNLRGENVVLDDVHRLVVRHLDGNKDLQQLVEIVVAFLKQGQHVLRRDKDNSPITEEGEMRQVLVPALTKVLQNLGRHALLLNEGTASGVVSPATA